MLGMCPAPVDHCRVLDLGCNDGTNLIAMAYALPQSQFVGIDLAGQALARGQAIVDELGLGNIALRQIDLSQMPAELGKFDYIIAHGIYSWVPATVRDSLLAICGTHLTDNGIAYVSYNVYPGAHFRDLTRGMMRYHVAKFSGTEQKIRQARALLKTLAESKISPDPYRQILQRELARAGERADETLFHDDLSDINQPVYFYQFVEHAARHGLQYLSEASLRAMQTGPFPARVEEHLNRMKEGEIIAKEQYLDFLKCRPFRQTLLCHNSIVIDRSVKSERLFGMRFAADLKPASAIPDLRKVCPVVFTGPSGAELVTDHPVVKTALACLAMEWPQSIAFDALAQSVRRELGHEIGGHEKVSQPLAAALIQAHLAGHVEFHAHRAPFVTSLSERPMASALARLQLRSGTAISTLHHQSIAVGDELGRMLIQLLDGMRDHATLVKDLANLIRSSTAFTIPERHSDARVEQLLEHLPDGLEINLRSLARLAILVG